MRENAGYVNSRVAKRAGGGNVSAVVQQPVGAGGGELLAQAADVTVDGAWADGVTAAPDGVDDRGLAGRRAELRRDPRCDGEFGSRSVASGIRLYVITYSLMTTIEHATPIGPVHDPGEVQRRGGASDTGGRMTTAQPAHMLIPGRPIPRMADSIKTASMVRGSLLPALVSALLAVCGIMATTASSASAASYDGVCESGEFCMGYMYNLSGGLYDNSGSDPDADLGNDRFVRNWAQFVGNNTWSMQNKGRTHEILVYDGAGYQGAVACLKRSAGILNLDGSWWKDRISSYKWVTSCPREIGGVPVGVWG